MPGVKAFPHVRDLFETIKGDGEKIALAFSAETSEVWRHFNKLPLARKQ
jgi:hypothetical protein